jgi:ABC-type transport system involved in cytochrome c biogenesis ATPase subunit
VDKLSTDSPINEKLIESITVTGLFGLYSYHIPSSSALGNAAINYGDNGMGKSTILRLVFHLLSPENSRGHRNFLKAT